MKLTAMLRAFADRAPGAEALVAGARRWTYAQLVADVDRAAGALAQLGIGQGDRVAVMTFNEPEFILAAFGAWELGAVLVPVNHKMKPPEVAYTVGHCGAALGIASPELLPTVRAGAPEIEWLGTSGAEGFAERLAVAPPFGEAHADDAAPAEILYTSGTTSAPKGCVLSHRALTQLAVLLSLNLDARRDERMLVAMPIWHSAPINVCVLPTLFMGGTVVLQREYHPVETFELIAAERITTFFGPTVAFLAPFRALAGSGREVADFDFSTMRRWLFGGAPIDAAAVERIVQTYRPGGHYQLFGMTETGPSGAVLLPHEQQVKPGSIGAAAMLGARMRVVDADGHDIRPGQTGEVWFLTDTVMDGYLDNPEATAAAFEGPWYRTGDIARMDDDGFYYIVDRLKDVIIVGGENVFSLEVEEAIATHPRVADVAVVGRPDPEWGQQLVAHITTSEGADLTVDELQDYLAPRLARYKIPRQVVMSAELPRNPSGKLLKHQLRAEAASEPADSASGG